MTPDQIKTAPLEMKWAGVAQVIAIALETGTPKGKAMALQELQRMAAAADYAVELQTKLGKIAP